MRLVKRAIICLLTLALLCSPLSVATGVVFAETAGDYEYRLINGGTEAEITRYNGAGGDVVIPSTLGGKPVTALGTNLFYDCDTLRSVTIPEGVTTIGDDAFHSCSALLSVTIPKGMTTIGARAFSDCTALRSVTIPRSVTTMGEGAFCQWYPFTMYAKTGSAAQRHALQNDIPFHRSSILGDVSDDDVVNTKDARVILQYAAGMFDPTAFIFEAADVTGDGSVNTSDARSILQFAAGIINKFPAEK